MDRSEREQRARAAALCVMERADIAEDWLRSHSAALGCSPIDLLNTDAGLDLVLRELVAIEHGLPM